MTYCECLEEHHNSKDCGNKRLLRRQYAHTEVKNTALTGFGLFASDGIDPGSLIIEFVGEVLFRGERSKACTNNYTFSLRSGLSLDAANMGNKARFINHSCHPNSIAEEWFSGGRLSLGIYSISKIAINEEITISYHSQLDFKCKCPSCS